MSYAVVAAVLVLLEWILAFFFIRGLVTGGGNNFLLGTFLGAELILLALAMICYIRASFSPRLIAEDRDEGLLW